MSLSHYLTHKNPLVRNFTIGLYKKINLDSLNNILDFYDFCDNNIYSLILRRSGENYSNHILRMLNYATKLDVKDVKTYLHIISHDSFEEYLKLSKSEEVISFDDILTNFKYFSINNDIDLINLGYNYIPVEFKGKSKLAQKIRQSSVLLNLDDLRINFTKILDIYDNSQDSNNLSSFDSILGKYGQAEVTFERLSKFDLNDFEIFNSSKNIKMELEDILIKIKSKLFDDYTILK